MKVKSTYGGMERKRKERKVGKNVKKFLKKFPHKKIHKIQKYLMRFYVLVNIFLKT